MRVKATSLGIYRGIRRREGDVFDVLDWDASQGNWMERLEEEAPPGQLAVPAAAPVRVKKPVVIRKKEEPAQPVPGGDSSDDGVL